MDVTILVEPAAGEGFRATCGNPLHLETAAPTRHEVVERMKKLIDSRLSNGAEVVRITVGADEHPLVPYAGKWPDDQSLSDWRSAVQDYRDDRDGQAEAY